ncbi:MAG: tetratricopeptide repeat protein [bacterium]
MKFYGREFEINLLNSFIDTDNLSKNTGIVYLYGEAGIGKSYLLKRLEYLNQPKSSFFWFQNDNVTQRNLKCFFDFFKSFFNLNDLQLESEKSQEFELQISLLIDKIKQCGDENASEVFCRIKPYLSWLAEVSGKENFTDIGFFDNRIEIIGVAIKEFFKLVSKIKPVVLIVEDIHWIDQDSLKIFQILSRNIDQYPIYLIANARPSFSTENPSLKLDKNINQIVLNLKELSIPAARKMVDEYLNKKISGKYFDAIYAKSKGNPFLLEQICRYVLETAISGKEVIIPDDVNNIVLSRLDYLSEDLKNTILAASVLGREFDISVLSELLKLMASITDKGKFVHKDRDFQVLITEGVNAGFWSNISEIHYIFKHSLVQSTVYNVQLKEKLQTIHNLAAQSITQVKSEEPSYFKDVAYHYERGNSLDKAFQCYIKSGEYAKKNYNLTVAQQCFEKALSITEEIYGKQDPKTTSIYYSLGQILYRQGSYDQSLQYLKTALKNQEKVNPNDPLVISIYLGIANNYIKISNYPQAFELLDKAGKKAESLLEKNHILYLQIYLSLGGIYFLMNEYKQSMDYFLKAQELINSNFGENDPRLAVIYNNLGLIQAKLFNYDKSFNYFKRALDIQTKNNLTNHPFTSNIYNNIGDNYSQLGNYQSALDFSEKSLQSHLKLFGKTHPEIVVIYNSLGLICRRTGKLDEALINFQKAKSVITDLYGFQNIELVGIHNHLSRLYLDKLDLNNAGKELRLTELNPGIKEESKNKHKLSFYQLMSEYYLWEDNYQKTENFLISGLKFLAENPNLDISTRGRFNLTYSRICRINQDFKLAQQYLFEAKNIFEKTKDDFHRLNCYLEQGIQLFLQKNFVESIKIVNQCIDNYSDVHVDEFAGLYLIGFLSLNEILKDDQSNKFDNKETPDHYQNKFQYYFSMMQKISLKLELLWMLIECGKLSVKKLKKYQDMVEDLGLEKYLHILNKNQRVLK